MEFLEKHKKQIVAMSLMFLGVVAGVAFFQSTAHATWWEFWKPSGDDEKAAADFLGKYGSYLQYSDNPIKSMLHTLGWGMVTLFYHIVTLIEDCLDGANLLSLFSFVDGKNATIHGIYGSVMSVVVWSVLVLSLVLVGYKLMVGKQSDLKNLTVNIFLSIGLLVLMPTLFGVGQYSGEAFSKGLFNDVKALNTSDKKPNESLAFGLIKQNCTDWAYVSQKNKWDDVKKDKSVNQLDEKDFSDGVYPLNNLITSKSASEMDTKQGKLLQYHLSKDDDNKTKPVKDASVASWAPKVFKNGYFQYTLTSTIGVLVGLAALAVAVLFNAFVIVRAIVELAMKRILAPVIFASDIETLQKSKMILSDIMKCYLTIGLTELGMVLFNFWVTYVNGKNMNLLLKVVCFVAGVSFLINGSTSVQRYFGIDIGLQDGKNGWMAALGVGTAIGKGSKAVKSTASNAVGTTVAGVAGGVSGIVSGLQKGAGMKLSSKSAAGGSATGNPSESLSERQDGQQQRQQDKQQQNGNNIQARRPSLARRAARATGQKIQSAATKQMEKHPAAAKLGSVTGGIAGGTAGLGIRAGRKLSGLDQSVGGSQQAGNTGKKDVAETRSDARKPAESANDPLQRTESLSQKPLEAQQQEQEAVEQPEQKPLEQQEVREQEIPQESLSHRQAETAERQNQQPQAKEDHQPEQQQEALSQRQNQQVRQQTEARQQQAVQQTVQEQPQTEVPQASQTQEAHQAETPQEAVQAEVTQPQTQTQQPQERQEATQVQTAEAPRTETPVEATGQQAVQQTVQEQPQTEVHQAETPSIRQQEVIQSAEATTTTPAGTHDYSQIVTPTTPTTTTGGSPTTTTTATTGSQPSVQQTTEVRQQASQPMEATQVQAQEQAEAHQQTVQQEVQVQEAVEQRQTKVPQKVQQTVEVRQQGTVTPAGTHDYSRIINGGSHTTTTDTGSQPPVQKPQSVQPTETKQSTVQKQKRPETTTTAPKNPVLNNPWGNVDNDRSR